MTQHIIITAAPKNDLANDSKRAYREFHGKISQALGYMADCGEDAAEQGMTILRVETFSSLGEFLNAWIELTDKPTFKNF